MHGRFGGLAVCSHTALAVDVKTPKVSIFWFFLSSSSTPRGLIHSCLVAQVLTSELGGLGGGTSPALFPPSGTPCSQRIGPYVVTTGMPTAGFRGLQQARIWHLFTTIQIVGYGFGC